MCSVLLPLLVFLHHAKNIIIALYIIQIAPPGVAAADYSKPYEYTYSLTHTVQVYTYNHTGAYLL